MQWEEVQYEAVSPISSNIFPPVFDPLTSSPCRSLRIICDTYILICKDLLINMFILSQLDHCDLLCLLTQQRLSKHELIQNNVLKSNVIGFRLTSPAHSVRTSDRSLLAIGPAGYSSLYYWVLFVTALGSLCGVWFFYLCFFSHILPHKHYSKQ